MVNIFGKAYYIDLDGITEKCRIETNLEKDSENEEIAINLFKYELIKLCIERILSEDVEIDESLGVFGSSTNIPISFKLAFNTLIKYEILLEYDEQ